jgi:hypothetical protein
MTAASWDTFDFPTMQQGQFAAQPFPALFITRISFYLYLSSEGHGNVQVEHTMEARDFLCISRQTLLQR